MQIQSIVPLKAEVVRGVAKPMGVDALKLLSDLLDKQEIATDLLCFRQEHGQYFSKGGT